MNNLIEGDFILHLSICLSYVLGTPVLLYHSEHAVCNLPLFLIVLDDEDPAAVIRMRAQTILVPFVQRPARWDGPSL